MSRRNSVNEKVSGQSQTKKFNFQPDQFSRSFRIDGSSRHISPRIVRNEGFTLDFFFAIPTKVKDGFLSDRDLHLSIAAMGQIPSGANKFPELISLFHYSRLF